MGQSVEKLKVRHPLYNTLIHIEKVERHLDHFLHLIGAGPLHLQVVNAEGAAKGQRRTRQCIVAAPQQAVATLKAYLSANSAFSMWWGVQSSSSSAAA